MSAASQLIQHTTECRLCHKPIARDLPLSIPIVGAEPDKRLLDYCAVLFKHIGKRHPKEYATGAALIQQYQTFVLLSAFEPEDPGLSRMFEQMRAEIFMRVRKNVPSEADLDVLAGRVAEQTGIENSDSVKLLRDGFQAVRDLCCELGAAAPQPPEPPNRIVTP